VTPKKQTRRARREEPTLVIGRGYGTTREEGNVKGRVEGTAARRGAANGEAARSPLAAFRQKGVLQRFCLERAGLNASRQWPTRTGGSLQGGLGHEWGRGNSLQPRPSSETKLGRPDL